MLFSGLVLPGPAAGEPAFQPSEGSAPKVLRLAGLDGKLHDLATYSGKVVIVHFFATWCEPCRAELGTLQALKATIDGRIHILAVDVAEAPGTVRRFLETQPVSFPVLMDSTRATARDWGVHTLPTTFIVDGQSRARLFIEGPIDWMTKSARAALDDIIEPPPANANQAQGDRPQ